MKSDLIPSHVTYHADEDITSTIPTINRNFFDSWFKVFSWGDSPGTKYVFHCVTFFYLIELDEVDHEDILRPLFTDGIVVELHLDHVSKTRTLRCIQKVWPWDDRPWIRGYGPLYAIHEAAPLCHASSSEIIRKVKGLI